MATNEGLRKTSRAIVANVEPDWCYTPFLAVFERLVPYTTSASLDWAVDTEANIRMAGQFSFTLRSRIPRVIGDKEGTGGGVFSRVWGGFCRPIEHSSTVRMGKNAVIRHGDMFWMNCNGPEGTPNTRGRAIFLEIESVEEIVAGNDVLAENFPYRPETFRKIAEMAPLIKKYSAQYGVPEAAVAGAIADEYNDSGWLDGLQDKFITSRPEEVFKKHEEAAFDSKLLNAMKHDLGPGNLKMETAWQLYQQYRAEFPNQNWTRHDIANYIVQDEGTAHVAALFMHDAQQQYKPLMTHLPASMQEAILVTGYKRGVENYNLEHALQRQPYRPGEGLRVLLQRFELLEALAIPAVPTIMPADRDGVKITR